MQKTFKINSMGDKYKVFIKDRTKLTNIKTETEEINFYFGNQKYIQIEREYLTNFLEHRLSISKAKEIEEYILNAIK
jgi:hypothetical protein